MKDTSTQGFTLIEMLVVVAIIGLLSSTILVGLGTARSRARDARRIADIRQIQTGLEAYYSEHNGYPTASSAETDTEALYTALGGLPEDPQGGRYSYTAITSGKYILGACLENARTGDVQSYVPTENEGTFDVRPQPPYPSPEREASIPSVDDCKCQPASFGDVPRAYCVGVGVGIR